MASFLLLPILPVSRGRHGYRPAFVVSSKAFTRHSRVQAALSGPQRVDRASCVVISRTAGATGRKARPTVRVQFLPAASRANGDRVPAADRAVVWLASGGGVNPHLPARPICASVPLLSWVFPISARVAARHENSPFSCKPDRLHRAQGTAR